MLLTGFALGVVLGFVFQRGRFCVTGAFRDVWLSKSTRWLTAFLVAIAVQAVLVQLMTSFGWIALTSSRSGRSQAARSFSGSASCSRAAVRRERTTEAAKASSAHGLR